MALKLAVCDAINQPSPGKSIYVDSKTPMRNLIQKLRSVVPPEGRENFSISVSRRNSNDGRYKSVMLVRSDKIKGDFTAKEFGLECGDKLILIHQRSSSSILSGYL